MVFAIDCVGSVVSTKSSLLAALHEAVRAGHIEALQMILLNGADINQLTVKKNGLTPLDIAIRYLGEDHAMTNFLRENGALKARHVEL